MANSLVNLMGGPSPYGGDYGLQAAQMQRDQKLAELMQQQSMQPIDVQMGPNGIPAPIPWMAVLAKALQGAGGAFKRGAVEADEKKLSDSDTQSANDLISALMKRKTMAPATQGVAPSNVGLDIGAPGLPQQAQAQLPGVPATAQQTAPDQDAQMAALLAANGGPRTQMVQQAMLPQMMNRQNMDYQNQLQRDTKTWENQQPMSTAAQQQIAAQGQQAQQNAQFTNSLPETAHERAQDQLERSKIGETANYHKLMTGQGLTEDGAPNPAVDAWLGQVLAGNAFMQNVPAPYKTAVAMRINSAPQQSFTPLAGQRFSLESNRIIGNYLKLPEYANTANGLQYLSRIDAALQKPGSVTDQELLDSLTKLNTAGNAITDAQVRIITDGKSVSDWANIQLNKLKTGGVLSNDQRAQIRDVANRTYDNYKKSYQPVYDQATAQLRGAGIPKAFWTIPDLNNLRAGQDVAGANVPAPGGAARPNPAPSTPPKGWILQQDAKGNKAYVSPDGKQFQEVP